MAPWDATVTTVDEEDEGGEEVQPLLEGRVGVGVGVAVAVAVAVAVGCGLWNVECGMQLWLLDCDYSMIATSDPCLCDGCHWCRGRPSIH